MAPLTFYALSLLALTQNALSLTLSAPEPTGVGNVPAPVQENGVSPRPTDSPDAPHNELRKRYDYTAPGYYCGFYSTSKKATCDIGTCGYFSTAGKNHQGCCYGGACSVYTTCYDYNQWTSSKCTGSCGSNLMNLICTYSRSAYCQTYSYPGVSAVGYGCDTDSASQTLTAVSTYISGSWSTTATITAIAAAAVQTSTSRYYYSSYSYSYGTYSSYRSGGSSYSSGYYNDAAVLAGGLLIFVIILGVAYGLWYLCAIGLIIYMCNRSKKLMAAWSQPGGVHSHAVTVVPVAAVPVSNVVSPVGSEAHKSAYFAAPAPGHGGYYDASSVHAGTPAPTGSPSPHNPASYPANPVSPAPTYASQPPMGQQGYGVAQPQAYPFQAYQPPGQASRGAHELH